MYQGSSGFFALGKEEMAVLLEGVDRDSHHPLYELVQEIG